MIRAKVIARGEIAHTETHDFASSFDAEDFLREALISAKREKFKARGYGAARDGFLGFPMHSIGTGRPAMWVQGPGENMVEIWLEWVS